MNKLMRSPSTLAAVRANVNSVQGARMLSSKVNFFEKNAQLNRPVSPHVEIYAFPPTALTSIAHRVTGAAMYAGLSGIGALSLVGADVPAIIDCAQANIPLFAPLSKLAVAYPIVHHYVAGIRHMVWDNAPQMLETNPATTSSMGVFAVAGTLSLGLSLYTIREKKDEEPAQE